MVDGTSRLSWADLWQEVERSSATMQGRGIGAGDIVSTQLPNGIDIVVLHLATELLGAIHNPLAVQFREHELDQVDSLLHPRLVVHPTSLPGGPDYRAIHAATAAGRAGRTAEVTALVRPASGESTKRASVRLRASDPAFILNTSGTVSVKGVVHTHEDAMYSTRVVAELIGIDESDVVLCVIPMTWGGGLAWGVRFALHTGATLVSMTRWDPDSAANAIDAERVTYLYGPPTVARDLVAKTGEWQPSGPLKMICAGAPIPRALCHEARERLQLSLFPGYGQTEHLHSTLGRPGDPMDKLTETDGSRLPGVDLIAVDEAGNGCPTGTTGDLLCRGPNVAAGYWNQPELSAETFRHDGWQVTQDLGSFDADGYLRVSGRKRDIIIRGGLNVSPREVEELVQRHPGVRDVAVVGMPDRRYGERICAFIVPSGGSAPSVEELATALTESGVARYKHPEIVRTIDALPLTSTGKVRHESLRELLRRESSVGDR
jgi:acyl-coenzyme A synthetase/AMP-(fatty) acid ligase